MTSALLVVDVQKDFCEGGALAVPGGNAVAEDINWLMQGPGFTYVVATRDWHNPLPDTNDGHFDKWPVHCVRNSEGARYNEALQFPSSRTFHVVKGEGANDYSGFQGWNDDPEFAPLQLDGLLKMLNVETVDIVGLAYEYCVKETAIDAARLGYDTTVYSRYTAGINMRDSILATRDMIKAGVRVL